MKSQLLGALMEEAYDDVLTVLRNSHGLPLEAKVQLLIMVLIGKGADWSSGRTALLDGTPKATDSSSVHVGQSRLFG